jgi:ribosomal protein L22
MTEKNYNSQQRNSKASSKQTRASSVEDSEQMQKQENAENKKTELKEEKVEEKKDEKKQPKRKKEFVKKDEAVANGISLPISTKDSVAICRFIKHKPIERAIADLELVEKFKKAIPMKGEIPHRKGKGMMAGRYMTKPVGFFIRLLKNLQANANINGIEEAVIVEAIPNRASRPYGKGGRKRKRTHIHIKVIEKNKLKKNNKKEKHE